MEPVNKPSLGPSSDYTNMALQVGCIFIMLAIDASGLLTPHKSYLMISHCQSLIGIFIFGVILIYSSSSFLIYILMYAYIMESLLIMTLVSRGQEN